MQFESLNVFFRVKKKMRQDELIIFYIPLGRFDIVGQSHQILHVAVIAAVYLHFYGLCSLFHSVIESEQCILPIRLKLGITDLAISS
jgi:hypothetical protein